MHEFLTAIKESSIDCKFNYDDNEKCLSFPVARKGVDGKKKYLTEMLYTDNQHETVRTRTKGIKKGSVIED